MSMAFHEDNEENVYSLRKQVQDLEIENVELKAWKREVLEQIQKERKTNHIGTNGNLQGCSSGACLVEKPMGMHTNGGNCYCSKETLKAKLRKLKNKLYRLKIDYTTNE